ncbi:hypothetical protein CEUSTIGMA_g12154.t1 [Chlamydomonas eustigma]|uniref:HECT-type E3 ubiquitin transferase n=1 Tax=Chlamydomonas eustigma TaxID=1157962 RepID=A0A250XP81_9CHLO|nr:hypothetical protein CEUSTIGMA_g12154.t1 [Chlamydomonas eustigma]|eukprot:GAX84732.1 hypothetical protein CEUSTIGMA_g12154.t1 [Chlamydomonas eustigma]
MVGFSQKPAVRLGGATRKEKTREELLEEIKAEREHRVQDKKRSGAVLKIQKYWRGYAARCSFRIQLASTFLKDFSSFVPSPNQAVPAVLVTNKLVPAVLFLTRPFSRSSGGKHNPLCLTSYPLKSSATSSVSPSATNTSSKNLLQVVRCFFALIMRSLTSLEAANCCLSLGLPETKEAIRKRWQWQSGCLLQMCCQLISCPGGDSLIDAAAVRLMNILTDMRQWRIPGASSQDMDGPVHAAVSSNLSVLVRDPEPLMAALARLITPSALSFIPHSVQPVASSAACPSPHAGVAAPTPSTLPKLQLVVTSVLRHALLSSADERSRLVSSVVSSALLVPGAWELLSEDVKTLLRTPEISTELCEVLCKCWLRATSPHQQTEPFNKTQHPASSSASSFTLLHSGIHGLWGLTNITLLLAGPGSPARGVSFQPGGSNRVLPVYAQTVAQMLPEVSKRLERLGKNVGPSLQQGAAAAAAAANCTSGTSQTTLPASDQALVEFVEKALASIWPLGSRPFLLQFLDSSEHRTGDIVQFAAMCEACIKHIPEMQRVLAAVLKARGRLKPAATPSLLNTLAFAPNVLPRLWRWLAPALGMPLEAPLGATRGLDVASLAAGFRDMSHGHAMVLGLFCRLYHHLLLVLDDEEMYKEQKPLTLNQSRAVATSLNSLVFYTYLPKTLGEKIRPSGGGQAPSLLAEFAPLLLRSLYERDVRHSFCQPLLWLAPYNEMFGGEDAQGSSRQQQQQQQGNLPTSLSAWQRATANMSLPALLDAAFQQQLLGGSALDSTQPASASQAVVGSFNAAAVVQSLMPAGALSHADETESLQSRAGEGGRPASLASVLKAAPHAIPFGRRVELFRALLEEDKKHGKHDRSVHEGGSLPIKFTVHRTTLLEDSYRCLSHLGPELKARLEVTFVNEQGLSEAGLDHGGLMKELLEEVVSRGFNNDFGLFSTTHPDGLIYPRPSADKVEQGAELLEFLGLMVGKALYEGILINVAFAPFFVARLQGRTPMFDDLSTLDPELHRSLLQVKRYDGNVEDLGLTFVVEDDFFGSKTRYELLLGWGDVPVTNDNRLLYCHLLADWHLNVRLGRAAEAFSRGLSQLIPPGAFRLFNPKELNMLISGDGEDGSGGVDVEDLKLYVRYSGGYTEESTTVKLFWKVLAEMSATELSLLLKFVTSCSRAPLGGFKYLHPPFTLHKVTCDASMLASLGGKDVDRLPSASTCFNMLKLPNYRRSSTLKEKILYSIKAGAGFELS